MAYKDYGKFLSFSDPGYADKRINWDVVDKIDYKKVLQKYKKLTDTNLDKLILEIEEQHAGDFTKEYKGKLLPYIEKADFKEYLSKRYPDLIEK